MALEGVRRSPRFEDAAAEGCCPRPGYRPGETVDLLFGLHRAGSSNHRAGSTAHTESADGDDRRREEVGRTRKGLDPRTPGDVGRGPEPDRPLRLRLVERGGDCRQQGLRHDREGGLARSQEDLDARLPEGSREPLRRDPEDARGRPGRRRRGLPGEAPEARPVRLPVGNVLEQRNEARLEGRFLRADGRSPAPQCRDATGSLGGVLRRDHRGTQPRQEPFALPENGRLRDDLRDLLEGDASRRRQDEAHRDLHLGEDRDRQPAVDGPHESRQRLVHRADDAVHRRQEGLFDLACGESRQQGVEGLEGDRPAAARGGPRAERTLSSLESGADDPALAGESGRVGLVRNRHRGLLRITRENEEAPLRRLGEGGFVRALRLPS